MHTALIWGRGEGSPSGEISPQNKMVEGKNAFNVLWKFLPFFYWRQKVKLKIENSKKT
jgi:hypothetical protein